MENNNIETLMVVFNEEINKFKEAYSTETCKFIGRILDIEEDKLIRHSAEIRILSYILPELLNNGCIVRTTTNEIAKACNCSNTLVNNVLGFAGYKYERDRVTHKLGYESKGLFERYYQCEYLDDKQTKMKRTSSVFNIVATQKLMDLLRDELGLEIKVEGKELIRLHDDSKANSISKKHK